MKTQFTCVQIYLCIRINLKVLINYLRINLCTDQLVYGLSCARIILGTDQLTGTDQLIYGSTMTTGSGLELNPGSSHCRKCFSDVARAVVVHHPILSRRRGHHESFRKLQFQNMGEFFFEAEDETEFFYIFFQTDAKILIF